MILVINAKERKSVQQRDICISMSLTALLYNGQKKWKQAVSIN